MTGAPREALAPAAPPSERVARNTALRAAAEVLGKLATLALTVVMTDRLGLGAVGQFGVALAITQLYWPIAGFGLDRLMLRDVAVDHTATARLVPQLNAFKFSVGLLCTALGTAFMAVTDGGRTGILVTFLLGLTLVATLIGSTAQSVFMAHERTQDFFLSALPVKVVGAVLGVIALLLGGGLIWVASTSLVAAIAGIAIGWWILSHRYDQPPAGLAGSPRTWAPLVRRSGPWGLQEIFGQITFRGGIIVLFLYFNETVAGEYRVAYQLLEATLFLPWSIGTSVLPLLARARRGESIGGEPPLEVVASGSIELVVTLMLPIALLLGLCAEPLIIGLFGSKASAAVDLLPFLAAASLLYGVGHIAGLVALSHLPGRRTVQATALTAAFSVAAVLLLVPGEAARGAAIAALATEAMLTALSLRLAIVAAGPSILRGLLSIAVLAGGVMAIVVVEVRDDLLLSVVLGGGAYVAVLLALEYRRRGPAWVLLRSLLPGSG